MTYPFIKGLDLSEIFYQEAVRPILAQSFPNLAYSAALIGPGSEVLGFDDPQSMDHDWGPRLMLFLSEEQHATCRERIDQALRHALPLTIHGIPTDLANANSSDDKPGAPSREGGVNHSVAILTVRCFFSFMLKADPDRELRPIDWLAVPEQFLRSLTAGRVFHDGLGQLEPIRARLRYYPHDIWLYLLACQWRRIAQEEHFMGRCGQLGDELGSRLVAARLVRDLMRLCFLMERQYAPYIKWLGTAFQDLECAGRLTPILTRILAAGTWEERQEYLVRAYECAAGLHNALGITAAQDPKVRPFYGRPFLVSAADRFVTAIRAAIADPEILALPEHLGAFEQFIDSTDALSNPQVFDRIKELYQREV